MDNRSVWIEWSANRVGQGKNLSDRLYRKAILASVKTVFVQFLILLLFIFLPSFYKVFAQGAENKFQPLRTETLAETGLVHIGDLIDVDVVGSLDFDWRGTLTPEGFLNGVEKSEDPIFALCRSEGEISADIAKEYGKILRDPTVVVKIIDRSGRPVAIVDGAVKTPHRFRIKRPVFLNELLIISGGITDSAGGEVRIYRPPNLNCSGAGDGDVSKSIAGQGAETETILLSDLLRGKKESNPQILSGDIVSVLEAFPIYVIGGVNRPRQMSSRSRTMLSAAVSSAGGLTRDAVESDVTIFRRFSGDVRTIRADLKKISDGAADDIELKPFDIVDVGQRGRERKKFPPVLNLTGNSTSKSENLPLKVVD
jgi:Periplasmic protein involved in polysaccharide export